MNYITGIAMPNKRKNSIDIPIVVALVLLTDLFILIPELASTPIRTVLGLPMVLFLPGYALIAALFPAKDDLDGIERLALGFGLSIAVVPLIGLGLNYTPWGIRLIPILISLSVFTLFMCAVAVYRRAHLPSDKAFSVSSGDVYGSLKAPLSEQPESRLDRILTIILVISVLASVVALTYVVITPKQGEKFTEFYILGMDGKADNYTTQYTMGDNGAVIIGVVNHEYERVKYTMDIRLNNDSLSIPSNVQSFTLEHNATWERPVAFTPNSVGDNMKLEFLLFKNDDLTVPYRDLHLWVNVTRGV
ncbi:DUF1616 domain-containing protein [uncultured Methanomethylovorans sp.]|mgnify:CR=1 FL=1|uniref:DUF1616 domain-containing protein n=1 Tax=uncultured Methanomethylovorans sp. TaxID=183759 RepID=UPI00261D07A8|nr:DUF1616 domain-containing protein [uncultured Methanomethylovorans sp.]